MIAVIYVTQTAGGQGRSLQVFVINDLQTNFDLFFTMARGYVNCQDIPVCPLQPVENIAIKMH